MKLQRPVLIIATTILTAAITILIIVLSTGSRQNTDPVVVYGSNDCHYCTDLKAALKTQRVPFEFKDISLDQAAFFEMMEVLADRLPNLSLEDISIPVVVTGEKVLIQPGAADVIRARDR